MLTLNSSAGCTGSPALIRFRALGGINAPRDISNNVSESRIFVRRRPTFLAAFCMLACTWAWSVRAALESGTYQTVSGVTVEERGDRVPGGGRVVPFSATVTFDLKTVPPSLTAVIPDAVLEGGTPFALTVRSSSGERLADGTYRFEGDFLQDIDPSGTQYLFDWRFSTSVSGGVVWNGVAGWAGGHIWHLAISDIVLVAQATLSLTRVGAAWVRMEWVGGPIDDVLESATVLTAGDWSIVTNVVTITGVRRSVVVSSDASHRFYRLRQPWTSMAIDGGRHDPSIR